MSWKISVLALTVLILAQSCHDGEQRTVEEELSYAHPESIIEAEQLSESLSNYVIVDLRKPEDYNKGHLPGAVQVWRTDITDTSYAYGGMMPQKQHLESLLGSLGVSTSDTVVIYDDKAECDAARLWWILKFYGHENVRLLNGGLVSWKQAGGIITTDLPEVALSEYLFERSPDSAIYSAISMLEHFIQDSGSIVVLDTRTHDEFSGTTHKKGAAKSGRIPTAINLDWAIAVDLNGNHKFRTAQELKSTYEGVGMNSSTPVVTYCHSGVRSAHTLFVLTQLLGYENVRNYDGSWTEWSHLK